MSDPGAKQLLGPGKSSADDETRMYKQSPVKNGGCAAVGPIGIRREMQALLNDHMATGVSRAFRKLGAAPCRGPDAEEACPLLLCNAVHHVLANS